MAGMLERLTRLAMKKTIVGKLWGEGDLLGPLIERTGREKRLIVAGTKYAWERFRAQQQTAVRVAGRVG